MTNAAHATPVASDPGLDLVEDPDVMELAIQLEARLMAYETAIATTSRMIARSLTDFLQSSAR